MGDSNCVCKMSIDPKCTILVTGFGPFKKYVVNASWEAVKELQKLWENSVEFSDVKLVAEEIPVSYDHVSTHIPQLWKEHNPLVSSHTVRALQFLDIRTYYFFYFRLFYMWAYRTSLNV